MHVHCNFAVFIIYCQEQVISKLYHICKTQHMIKKKRDANLKQLHTITNPSDYGISKFEDATPESCLVLTLTCVRFNRIRIYEYLYIRNFECSLCRNKSGLGIFLFRNCMVGGCKKNVFSSFVFLL